ncbi:MAG: DNA recombination protein RmuC [Clostridia bacterium]|nr:DNA recombination protein RmuC [Clostridia bacterium]
MPTLEFLLLMFTLLVIGSVILFILNKMFHLINNSNDNQFNELQRDIKDDIADMAGATNTLLTSQLDSFSKFYDSKSQALNSTLNDMEKGTLESLERIYRNMDNRLNSINTSFLTQFGQMRKENNEQIDRIRSSVEEKLDKNLTTQVEKSFNSVIIHMTELQKSMTELQGLSGKVSNLDKSLNGIKTRGIMGEIQLKNLIADILSPNQYCVEIPTVPNSQNHVEIAVKIPLREGDGFVYLPIDSKCHLDRYEQLLSAYDTGDKVLIDNASKAFANAIIEDSKTIHDKYILTPHTTPYGILFVPFEGMYSEIVKLNILDKINSFNITVAGPYTLTAILGTVLNYWQALIIEKKSDDIRITLEKVKAEFSKFNSAFEDVQKSINAASNKLDALQTTRLNAMRRALSNVNEYQSINESHNH